MGCLFTQTGWFLLCWGVELMFIKSTKLNAMPMKLFKSCVDNSVVQWAWVDNSVQWALDQYLSAQCAVMWKWSHPSTVLLCDTVWASAWLNNIYIHICAYLHVCPCILLGNYIRIPRGAANVGHLQLSTLKIKTILIPNSRHYAKSPVASTLAYSHLNITHEDSLFLLLQDYLYEISAFL